MLDTFESFAMKKTAVINTHVDLSSLSVEVIEKEYIEKNPWFIQQLSFFTSHRFLDEFQIYSLTRESYNKGQSLALVADKLTYKYTHKQKNL
jgi:hypothetical protein